MSMHEDLAELHHHILGRRIDEALAIVRDLEAIEEAKHEKLLKDLQWARGYSYEANMGDYSTGSITRAKEQVDAATQALIDAGYEVPTW